MVNYTIENFDECIKMFDELPREMIKISKKAMRDAARATTKQLKSRIPARWKRIIKSTVDRTKSGRLYASIRLEKGIRASGKQGKGEPIDDWFKAYWQNYGTLSRRDPQHHFSRPIAPSHTEAAKKRKNNTGVKPQHFFEEAIEGYEKTFMDAFKESLAAQFETRYKQ